MWFPQPAKPPFSIPQWKSPSNNNSKLIIESANFQLQSATLFKLFPCLLLTFLRPGKQAAHLDLKMEFSLQLWNHSSLSSLYLPFLPHKSLPFTLSLLEHLSFHLLFLCSYLLVSSSPLPSFFLYIPFPFPFSHHPSLLPSLKNK